MVEGGFPATEEVTCEALQASGAFLTIVDRLLYMNSTYAFSYLAIYNDPFKKCAQNAYKKIAQSGLQAIPLDDVYTGASLAGTFAMAIFSTAVAQCVSGCPTCPSVCPT